MKPIEPQWIKDVIEQEKAMQDIRCKSGKMTQAGKAVIDQQEGTEAGASRDDLGAPPSLSALC